MGRYGSMIVNQPQHNPSMRHFGHLLRKKCISLLEEKISEILLMVWQVNSRSTVLSVFLLVRRDLYFSKRAMKFSFHLFLLLLCKKPSISCLQIQQKVISSSYLQGVRVLTCFMITKIGRNSLLLQYMRQNKNRSMQEKKIRRLGDMDILVLI